jgi:NTE family protein
MEKYITADIQTKIDKIVEKIGDKKLDYENIVFSGGGVKGLAEIGTTMIMKKLIDNKCMLNPLITDINDFTGFAGTSAGSFIAMMYAIGYNTDEVFNIMMSIDFEKIRDDNHFIITDIYNLYMKYGWSGGTTFESYVELIIKDKTSDGNYTFGQLYKDKGKKLVIVGTNINLIKPVYFSHETFPDLPIKDAIRVSASLPFVFQPKVLQIDGVDNYFADGGITNNYPLNLFNQKSDIDTNLKNDNPNQKLVYTEVPVNEKTIGIRIVNRGFEDYDNKVYSLHNTPITDIQSYAMALVNVYFYGAEQFVMNDDYWRRTIGVETDYVPLTQFKVSDKMKVDLINDGIAGALEFYS